MIEVLAVIVLIGLTIWYVAGATDFVDVDSRLWSATMAVLSLFVAWLIVMYG